MWKTNIYRTHGWERHVQGLTFLYARSVRQQENVIQTQLLRPSEPNPDWTHLHTRSQAQGQPLKLYKWSSDLEFTPDVIWKRYVCICTTISMEQAEVRSTVITTWHGTVNKQLICVRSSFPSLVGIMSINRKQAHTSTGCTIITLFHITVLLNAWIGLVRKFSIISTTAALTGWWRKRCYAM